MAKLEGITVEINGDATGLNNALKDTNKELSNAQSELTQVNRLLKLDPSNTTLLAQKQELLSNAVKSTSDKLETLKQAQEQANKSGLTNTEAGQKAYRELEREIVATENSLKKYSEQLENTKSASADAQSGIKGFGKAVDDAGNSTSRFGDIVKANLTSEAIIAGLKGMANIIVDISKSLVNLGKEAISAYGEFEQLVGGVETLFKDSADVVQNYANNAYKTAGLSANEYMETVTSFSASLLQSLNGDTAESAKIADMAITDMADNANKMGTSMSSIQSAYQGFAKQNYTMLDNLKLGYGGTKTEMERLLKDATAISGVQYDISSLNDVYNAIHVIQGELGITGTTAKEASTTIQGSINAMKGAWQNLLVGMADGTQNMDQLISNFVDSILTVGDNLIPRISQALDGIVQLIVGLADQLLPQVIELGGELITKLIEGIVNNIGTITESVVKVVMQFTQTLVTMLPQIVEAGITVLLALMNGIVEALPELIPAIVEAVYLIIETLIDHIDEIINAGIQILLALIEGIINSIPVLVEHIPEIIEAIINAVNDNIVVIIEGGIMILMALIEGLIKAIPQLIKAIPQIITAIVNGFKNGLSKIVEIGKFIVEGIWNGILNAKDWLLNKIKSFASTITDGIKDFFGIHSPSRVMRDEVGKYLAQGIGLGFETEMPKTISEMANTLNGLTDDLTASINAGMPSVNKNITAQNFYTTKAYQNTTEIVRQPSEVIIQVDKTQLGKVVVPAYNAQMKILGGTLA